MREILTRKDAACFLRNQYGLRTTAASLATMASRGGGPRVTKMGRYSNYLKADLVDWAAIQCRGFFYSTSTIQKEGFDNLFLHDEDLGDLPEADYHRTGDPYFDEITRLEEDGELQSFVDLAGKKYRQIIKNI